MGLLLFRGFQKRGDPLALYLLLFTGGGLGSSTAPFPILQNNPFLNNPPRHGLTCLSTRVLFFRFVIQNSRCGKVRLDYWIRCRRFNRFDDADHSCIGTGTTRRSGIFGPINLPSQRRKTRRGVAVARALLAACRAHQTGFQLLLLSLRN